MTSIIVRRHAIVLLLISAVGCARPGAELANVTGRVTLDGKPVSSARLTFQPDGNRSPSTGFTEGDGRYKLLFKRGVEGAMIGMHTVQIQANRAKIPAKYGDATELQREVKPGSNEIDFELTSK
jgi:hypothetical protein